MSFLLGFLGAIVGIIVIILVIVLIIYYNIRKTIGKSRMKELVQVAKNSKSIKQQEYARVKNVSGMTKLFEPQVKRDFPDFNKELLFSKLESNLIKILTAIEEKSLTKINKDEDLELMYSKIEEKINVLQENNQSVKYDDIVFHEHAIKQYIRSMRNCNYNYFINIRVLL